MACKLCFLTRSRKDAVTASVTPWVRLFRVYHNNESLSHALYTGPRAVSLHLRKALGASWRETKLIPECASAPVVSASFKLLFILSSLYLQDQMETTHLPTAYSLLSHPLLSLLPTISGAGSNTQRSYRHCKASVPKTLASCSTFRFSGFLK